MNDIFSFFSVFGTIFSLSFLVALTGALSPGPLLTYTIIKSAKATRSGWLIGFWVILGHAALESVIIIVLLLGFSAVLKNIQVVRIIGLGGGFILIWFGYTIIRDVVAGKVSTDFLDPEKAGASDTDQYSGKYMENPVIGGLLVSMANPYWWAWWATVGFAFMLKFDISLSRPMNLLAFFLGHEAGDLIWYVIVSTLSFFGLRRINPKAYLGVLIVCGIFMMLFGVWLGVSPFFSNQFPG